MKRWIAGLLCALMLATILPLQTYAAGTKTVVEKSVDTQTESNREMRQTVVTVETGNGTESTGNGTESTGNGTGKLVYLSDFAVPKMIKCSVGWGSYTRDKNLDGNPITLRVEGNNQVFKKGITAHANAELIYDLGENYADYNWFEAYLGVDAYRNGNGYLQFSLYKSTDKTNWTKLTDPAYPYENTYFRGNTNAAHVKLDISGYRYFRVVADACGVNTADHSTLADAKFYTEGYVAPTIDFLHDASWYSAQLAGLTYESIVTNEEHELLLLQYQFMKKLGYQALTDFLTTSDNYAERIAAFQWIFNDIVPLREFLNGGNPINGNYLGALDVLAELYGSCASDLEDTTALRSPDTEHAADTRGDLYRRMMLTMALVCADGLSAWMGRAGYSDPVKRYTYFKENYVNSKIREEIFENLGVDEMRWVIGNNISDAEIVWLNDYARAHPRGGNQTSYPILYSPHHHIAYQWYDYDKDYLYSEENRDRYVEKYMLYEKYEQYGLTYGLVDGVKVQRLWMVFEDGAVCGNISRTGANLAACFGVPACEVGQPGHAAFLIMNKSSKTSEMIWGIDNNISGWTQSSNSRRMPADWGNSNAGWNSGWLVPYILLSQAALNDLPNYTKAEEIMMLLDLAGTDEEREACCRAALSYMPYHLDAWLTIVQMYAADTTKTVQELADLAAELCSRQAELYLYPKTLYDLLQLLRNRMNTILSSTPAESRSEVEAEIARVDLAFQNALVRATGAAAADTAQPDVSKYIANTYLNSNTYDIASFSFDGENAGKLVFSDVFSSARFRICLNYTDDGEDNETWIPYTVYADNTGKVTYKLTEEELAQITAENDILIWLDGWPGNGEGGPIAENAFRIDIKPGTAVSGIEFNDNENRFLGSVSGMEYSLDGGKSWASLTTDTAFPGENSILVHKTANGTTLKGTDSAFVSTTDNTTTRSYISIRRLTLAAYSSEQGSQNDYARHAIDGLTSTRWHNLWNGTDKQKYITLKTDEPTYFSGLDYTPCGGNGTIFAGQIYTSLDGETWIPVKTFSGWANNTVKKTVSFTPTYGQYLKLVVTESAGGFVSARKLELFEDTTVENKQIVGVSLLTLPTRMEYMKGETLDLTGAQAKLVYEDNTYTVLPVSLLTPNTTLLDQVGSQRVTLTYGKNQVTFHVTVREQAIVPTAVSVTRLPDKDTYYAGDPFDPSGMLITATDGTTTVYLSDDRYTIAADLSGEGTKTVTVTMNGTELSDSFEVTVKKAIVAIEITEEPEKQIYELGDALDTTGLTVTAVYADDTRAELTPEQYLLENTDVFSEEDGNPAIPVLLADKQSIQTAFYVTVYPYFTRGGVRYSADKATHTCHVTSIDNAGEFVSIPASVRFGSTTYTVTGVDSDVLGASAGVKAVSLPGTIQSIGENAFFRCPELQKVYLTAHTGFEDLTVADNAFNTDVEIVLYAASEELSNELKEQPFAGNLGVDNVSSDITDIEITPPFVTTVSRGQTPDWEGYGILAILSDGNKVPLDPATCTLPTADTDVPGEHEIVLTLIGTEHSGSFILTVQNSILHITEHPQSAAYYSTDAVIAPLSVTVVSDQSDDEYDYQWYRSESGAIDHDRDAIDGATAPLYVPAAGGFYYVRVTIRGTDIAVYSIPAEIGMGDYAALIGTKGYDTLSAAIADASAGATVELIKDVTLSSGITVSRSLTLNGNGHTVIRGKGFTGNMFTVTGGTLTADHVTLDGGAGWYGETHEQLQRGCLSSGTVAKGTILRLSGSACVVLGGEVSLQNNYNTATETKNTTGGAVYAENSATIVLNGTTIRDNYSYLFGSAIYMRDSTTLTINGCFIHGNSGNATYNTTVICVDNNGVCTVNDGTFCHNVGTAKGGVFWVSNGKLTLNGGVFEDNISTNGAAVYLNGSAAVTVNGAEKLQDIYLLSGKTVTIGADQTAAVPVVTQTTAAQSEIVRLASGVKAEDAQQLITINGSGTGINGSGNLTIPCSDHTESSGWKTRRAATCTEKGEEYTWCDTCKAVLRTRDIDCCDHTPEEVTEVPARCGVAGTTAGTQCAVCGEHLSGMEPVKALEHQYVTTCVEEAGCTKEGTVCHTCSLCLHSYTESVPMNGHDMEITVTVKPTNHSTGMETHVCHTCGETYESEIPMLTYVSGDINKDGYVNLKDVVRFLRYLTGDDIEVEKDALDVNGDDTRNIKDLVRLLKYVAGEPVEIF